MAERLRGEASAYLRQHADNPVDWWPFGDEAFAEAERRNVPVFISVGYAACHWCHVMAHESFEDADTAAQLNGGFVSIKVDREERPDVDAVYMAATQAMTGEGGWPMSVFALPDGRTFFAGTYFGPRAMPGRPSFRQVLDAVSDAWTNRRAEVDSSAARLAGSLGAAQRQAGGLLLNAHDDGAHAFDPTALSGAVDALAAQEDPVHGGFGSAPKFPPSSVLAFLLARSRSGADDAAGTAAGLADRALASMAVSGIHDVLGGGFARYAVDRAWAVPHFEKMLYDNVQLLRLYARWSVDAGTDDLRGLGARAARGVAGWMRSELTVPGGAFASSLDADTLVDGQRVEGGTYTWTRGEIDGLLGGEAAAVMDLFDPRAGRMEDGQFTLHPGRAWNSTEQELWDSVSGRLMDARSLRPQPARDDKVVAGWNGLAVAGLADAGALLGDASLIGSAEQAAGYLLRVHWDGAVLRRVSHHGESRGIEGLLEDYAGCAEGFFALYAATGEPRWYQAAQELLNAAVSKFVRTDGTIGDLSEPVGPLLSAQAAEHAADPLDNATPSGVALFAGALLTSAAYSASA
ncbi:thioredoxin domain-containing protein, partial [Arthrobacter sp. H5]|uniref:thioredoxin domain-containing protein n=1 Tax=Arthrobacter sp. H5 TaxID=1267973 RepID=UPI00068435DF